MKGIVFTEFLEMVESTFGVEMTEEIIEAAQLASGGAYTAVGNYDHREMLSMVGALSKAAGIPAGDLAQAFGRYLFKRFVVLYPHFFAGVTNALDMLARIDGYIHVEVHKLYADAELPHIQVDNAGDGSVLLTYRSARPFADLAEGLIRGCIEHFGETIGLSRSEPQGAGGTQALFLLTRTIPEPA
jgi:Haem-NO-binding